MIRRISRRQFLAGISILASARQGDITSPVPGLPDTISQTMARFRIPGISFALITEGRQIWTRGFGVKDARANDLVNVDTVFAAGSLTKPVFAYAVLELVEQKLLALDTPLAAHLPDDLLRKEPRLRLVTARMLLSHTSGIAAPLEAPTFNFPPGERFAYASTGFLLLQLVVERVTGKSLAEFMRVNLLEPLGMDSSSFEWTDRLRTSAAVGHFENGQSRANRFDRQPTAAASLLTTARDYARFVVEILQPSRLDRFHISEALKKEMSKPQVKVADRLAWGLGWGLEEAGSGHMLWHWGDQDIFKSFVFIDPIRRSGLVIFTNSRNGSKSYSPIIDRAVGGQHPSLSWLESNRLL